MTIFSIGKSRCIVLIAVAASLVLLSSAIATEYTFNIQATLFSEEVHDQPILAGTRDTGSFGYDEGLDSPKIPAQPSEFLTCYFDRPEWESPYGSRYSGDFREITNFSYYREIWTFDIDTDFIEADLLLYFESWPPVNSNITFQLTDLDEETSYDLHMYPEVLIPNLSGERHFMLVVGDDNPSTESTSWGLIKQVY